MQKKLINYFVTTLALLASACIFGTVFSDSAIAAGDPSVITISTQPASTTTVDAPFSQQPAVLVKDSNNQPVAGIVVTAFKASGEGSLKGGLTATTDSAGLATFQNLKYNKTDSFTISFIYSGGSPITSNALQLLPGAVSVSTSSISVDSNSVIADGQSITAIKIQCEDQYGNLIPGANVGVSVSGSNNTLTKPNSADDPGMVTINLTSTTAESKIVSVTINNTPIQNSSPINFVAGKIAKLTVATNSPVTAGQSSQIVVTGEDAFGNMVSNDSSTQVVLSVDNGGSLSAPLITFTNGTASSTVSKTTAGTVNLTASVGTINAETHIVFSPADNINPTVTSQYPLGGSANIPVDVIPYADFSKTMDDTTLNNGSVELRESTDDSIVPAEILVANGGKRVIIQPDSVLSTNTQYYIFIDNNVSDSSQNTLASSYKSNPFTTAASTQLSSASQEQNIIKTVQSAGITTNTAPTSQTTPQSSSNNTSAENSSSNSSSITVTAGGSNGNSNNDMALYNVAGISSIFKNFNMTAFENWFVANFIWVIAAVILIFAAYLFWIIYVK